MEIQQFLEKDYQRIKSLLSNGGLFLSVQNEEKAIQIAVSHIEQASKQLMEQRKNQIDQRFQVKMNAIGALLSKLKMANSNIGVLNHDDINRLETALGEMLQILELQKTHELMENEAMVKTKKEASISDYKSRTKPALEKHYEEAQEKLYDLIGQMNSLEQYYETASFDSAIWDPLRYYSPFPLVYNIRLGERELAFSGMGTSVTNTCFIPEIVPFFGKNSLLLSYKEEERLLVKNAVDNIFLRSLMSAKAGNILFYFIDGQGNGGLFLDYLNMSDSSLDLYHGKIYVNPQEIETTLLKLQSKSIDINQKQRKNLSIEEYNSLNPKTAIPYRIVFIDSFPNGLTPGSIAIIKRLVTDEINSGIHFVFLVKEQDVSKVIPLPNTLHIVLSNDFHWEEQSISQVKQRVLDYTDGKLNMNGVVAFSDYYDVNVPIWEGVCDNVTEIPLGDTNGKNYNLVFRENGNATDLSLQHMIISGSSGCGKSFLLHELITGMSLKYSPAQVRFFLIDLKGTEFKQYDVQKLPHAEFIAMNGDAKFGLHVLKQVEKKISERRDLFNKKSKESGKQINNLESFRKAFPTVVMPRYYIVIDEYQTMYQDSEVVYDAKMILENVARIGRSYGFNLILASQTIEVSEEVFKQISIRVAMRLDISSGRKLLGTSEYPTDRLKVGQAFINCGSVDSTFVQSYFLPSEDRVKYLQLIREKWDSWEQSGCDHRLIVFDSEADALLCNNLSINKLKIEPMPQKLFFSPGEKLRVDYDDLISELIRDRGNNILFVGGMLEASLRAINGCLMSMMQQFDENNVKIDIFNFVSRFTEKLYPAIIHSSEAILKKCPKSICHTDQEETDAAINAILSEIEDRREDLKNGKSHEPHLVVFYQTRECDALLKTKQINEYTGVEESTVSDTSQKLSVILRDGPLLGVHCLVHFKDAYDFDSVFGEEDIMLFNHRVLLQMSSDDSYRFIRSKAAAVLSRNNLGRTANRALYYNAFEPTKDDLIIKPYEFEYR